MIKYEKRERNEKKRKENADVIDWFDSKMRLFIFTIFPLKWHIFLGLQVISFYLQNFPFPSLSSLFLAFSFAFLKCKQDDFVCFGVFLHFFFVQKYHLKWIQKGRRTWEIRDFITFESWISSIGARYFVPFLFSFFFSLSLFLSFFLSISISLINHHSEEFQRTQISLSLILPFSFVWEAPHLFLY